MTVLVDDNMYAVEASPGLPFTLKPGVSQTFRVSWNWANHTGRSLRVVVSVSEGSGANVEAEIPYVGLIAKAYFNSSISIKRFNVTVENAADSVTYVNITELTIDGEQIPSENITLNGEPVSFPYSLNASESVLFTCAWNWTSYKDKSVTVAVKTLQGYVAEEKVTPH